MDKVGLNNILKSTVYSSLFIQVLTGIVDIYVYFLPAAGELSIIKKMLELEIFVQFIEGTFYVWFASIFSHVKNITPNRYYDWAITTPTMLFTMCLYLDYLGERDKPTEQFAPLIESPHTNNTASKKQSVKEMSLWEYLKQNLGLFLPIFFLNWIMLIFGYLGEIGELDNKLAVLCGFLPFIVYFVIIHENFAKHSSFYGKVLYWIFFSIWSLYGLVALLSYYWKNIAFNILDLFAKNFFGMILAYTLYINM
uniref:Uncharacterized protein n=1 Tax=viral metagenome TaxID=1070528 RepID=A0A6C0HI93_9ZZZZ